MTFCKEQLYPGLLAGAQPASYDLLCLALVRLHVEHYAQAGYLQYKKATEVLHGAQQRAPVLVKAGAEGVQAEAAKAQLFWAG